MKKKIIQVKHDGGYPCGKCAFNRGNDSCILTMENLMQFGFSRCYVRETKENFYFKVEEDL